MNITIGIATSFIVGGLLLVALLNLNIRIMQNSADLTADQIVKQNLQTVQEFVEFDLMKAGYLNGGEIPYNQRITTADPAQITFNADLNQDGVAENVTWTFDTASPVSATENPDDYILRRNLDGTITELEQGVTSFSLAYFDSKGRLIESPSDIDPAMDSLRHIRKIRVSVICQSGESIDRNRAADTSTYAKAFWQKMITPLNL